MDKQGKIPVTMRILAALGMLEGRGILPTILIILMVVIGLAVFIYQGNYLGLVFLILGIVLFVLNHPRRRRQFKAIKTKYGITINPPYGLEHLTRLLLGFNENSDIVLGIQDHTFIKIDGSLVPLIFGSVSYRKMQMEGASDTTLAVFLLVQGSDFSDLRLKYQDVFELGCQQKEISIYWVKNLQRLTAILTPAEESKAI
jgi:hypothetical protein